MCSCPYTQIGNPMPVTGIMSRLPTWERKIAQFIMTIACSLQHIDKRLIHVQSDFLIQLHNISTFQHPVQASAFFIHE